MLKMKQLKMKLALSTVGKLNTLKKVVPFCAKRMHFTE